MENKENKEKVLEFLKGMTRRHAHRHGPVWVCESARMIGLETGLTESQARHALNQLVEDGTIEKGHFGRGDCVPYSYLVKNMEEDND